MVVYGKCKCGLTPFQFAQFVKLMDRLAAHPYSYMEKDFIMTYRRFLKSQAMLQEIPPVSY